MAWLQGEHTQGPGRGASLHRAAHKGVGCDTTTHCTDAMRAMEASSDGIITDGGRCWAYFSPTVASALTALALTQEHANLCASR